MAIRVLDSASRRVGGYSTGQRGSLTRARIAITSDCNLRCRYCFIDKDRGETMSLKTMRSVLDRIISSPGFLKVIGVYGGEAMLFPALVEALVSRARLLERRCGKDVRLSLATNGLLFQEAQLLFFLKHDVHIAISFDGLANDELRIHKDGRGSAGELKRKLPIIFDLIPRSRLTALQGIHPDNVSALAKNFQHIASLGFENVNFEVIQGPFWSPQHRETFSKEMEAARVDLIKAARNGGRLFLQSVNSCLFEMAVSTSEEDVIQAYPSGKVSSVPYPFANADNLQSGRAALGCRQEFSRRLARDLVVLSRKNELVFRYIKEAAELGCSQ